MIKVIGLLSPVIVPFILSVLLLLSSERNNKPKKFLSAYMLMISFVFLANLFYFEHNYKIYSWVHSVHIATVLGIYPGAYVYILLLLRPDIPVRRLYLHFIPALFFLIASASIFFPLLSPDERIIFLKEYRFHPDFSRTWMKILYYVRMANIATLFIQVVLYLVLTMVTLGKHHQRMEKIFSNPDKYRMNWLRFFNIALALAAFVSVFLYAVNPAKLFGDDRYLAFPLLLIAIILWFLGIMGNNQQPLPSEAVTAGEEDETAIIPGSDLSEKLIRYFNSSQPFLDPELKIWDVAREIGTNRTYISQAINREFNQNFAGFVNSYRIRKAEEIIRNEKNVSLTDLADKVGFGSVSSLIRSFQEFTGKSVTDYRKTI